MFTKTIIKEVKVVDEVQVNELKAEIKQIKADFASEKRIYENEAEIKVGKATEKTKSTKHNRVLLHPYPHYK